MRELADAGLNAEQCFQISEASYRSAKSTPARLFLRFRQYVAYPIQLGGALLARRVQGEVRNVKDGDVCVVSTNTFYAPLLATYLHPQVVHLVYDLFPEAMIHSGKWTEGTLKVRLVRWITRQTWIVLGTGSLKCSLKSPSVAGLWLPTSDFRLLSSVIDIRVTPIVICANSLILTVFGLISRG